MAYEKLNRRIEETRCKGRIAEIEQEMARLTTQLLYWQFQLERIEIAEENDDDWYIEDEEADE